MTRNKFLALAVGAPLGVLFGRKAVAEDIAPWEAWERDHPNGSYYMYIEWEEWAED